MLSIEKFCPSCRSGYSEDGALWRICHKGKNPDMTDDKWYVNEFVNNNKDWHIKKAVFTGALGSCIEYVNSVSDWTD